MCIRDRGTCFRDPVSIKSGEYEDAKDSDIVIITSGIARKPGQTRIELTQTNVNILKSITPEIVKAAPNALYIIVSNPVDIMTYVSVSYTHLDVYKRQAYYRNGWKESAGKMLKNAVRILIAFYISGMAYVAFVERKIFRWDFIAEVLLLKKFPGWSEFLVSFAAVLLVGILVFLVLKRMNGWILLGSFLLSVCLLYTSFGL